MEIRLVGKKHYRCTAGHEWEGMGWGGRPINLNFGPGLSIKNLCPYCLEALLREFLKDVGRVEEVEGETGGEVAKRLRQGRSTRRNKQIGEEATDAGQ